MHRWIKRIVNFLFGFWRNFPSSTIFFSSLWNIPRNCVSTNSQSKYLIYARKRTQNPAGVRVFPASNFDYIRRRNEQKNSQQITYITNKNRFEKPQSKMRKWCNSFGWFLPNFFGAAHEKIRASIFMRCIYLFEFKRIWTIPKHKKQRPHFVSVIGKHLQILRDCDFTTARRWNAVLFVRFF